jgi:muramidase (phage lysozyme)
MARISTGQTYGETNRSTAAQLLGGIPTDATSGAIAQSVINEPALRPQASPVSTYQQVGAPTIGGPVKFFAPPDLPAPSQDMARIAAALGGFSPILANLGESYVQRKKDEDARAQLAGQGVVQRLSLTAPGQDFIAARDSLWRQAQAGDAGALAAYQQLQALSPLQQAYAQRYAGQAVLREDISTAPDRFKAIPDIGGTPIDQIPPGDPRLSAAMASLYRVPANDPAGFAELMPQIAAKNGEISRAHMTMHTARKAQAAGAATQANTVSLFSGNPNAADVAAGITRQLNIARQSLGVEPYQDQLKALPDMLVTAVIANSIGPDGKPDARRFQALAGVAHQVLANIRIGPNGQESLLNAYGVKGGAAMQLDLQLKLLAKNKELAGAVDAFAGSAGEDLGHQIAAMTKVGDPSLTPAQRDAALTRGAAMIAAQTSNPQERAAAMSALTSTFNASQAAFTAPMQREAERTIMFDYAKDPATEIERIRSLRRSGQLPVEAANRIEANYRLLQGAEMRPWVRASREAVEMAMKPEIDAVKLITSDGGKNITEKERLFLITRRAELTGDVERMRLKALSDGSGVAGYRAQLGAFTKALLPQAPKPPNLDMTPLFTSPEDWQKNLPLGNAGGRGAPQANADLARRVDTGRVMGLPAFTRNFEAWIERGEMSDAMKLMIKRSGYGAKPAEFWRKQWKNQHGDTPMPAEYQGLMPLRDQMKISYQPAPSTAEPRNQLASNLGSFWQNLSTSAANALMPPAAAGEMPMGQVRLGTPVVGTPKLNANAKAWLAAISAGGFEGAGYNTYYGGGAFDNTKGHPMRVVRPPGGIPSSAAGRYQFMPDTWTGLHGGKNPPMTPANQDTGAYQLALNRGVDINTAPPTIENVRKLAVVWATLPVNTTSGAGYYKGQGGAGFARFRQTWNTELSRYSGR